MTGIHPTDGRLRHIPSPFGGVRAGLAGLGRGSTTVPSPFGGGLGWGLSRSSSSPLPNPCMNVPPRGRGDVCAESRTLPTGGRQPTLPRLPKFATENLPTRQTVKRVDGLCVIAVNAVLTLINRPVSDIITPKCMEIFPVVC
jgi:hypothetical protein